MGWVSCLVIFFLSCGGSRNEEVNPNAQNIILSDTSATTGSLEVRVFTAPNNSESNATVWLYASYEDLSNNISIFQLNTLNNGIANFGFINYGNYYIRAEKVIGLTLLTNTPGDVIQVQARKNIRANVLVQ